MTDLNTLVNVTGITLTSANAINDQGQVLATGIIPEPEIHLMLLVGLGLLGLMTRRHLAVTDTDAGMVKRDRYALLNSE
ncbi:MAG: PEP-CTERM sorting domain-containing protein [Nitrosospira multiformis]|nr:PEP-CTERM sorting domain-containing protein [Nitrosospira multiformis]